MSPYRKRFALPFNENYILLPILCVRRTLVTTFSFLKVSSARTRFKRSERKLVNSDGRSNNLRGGGGLGKASCNNGAASEIVAAASTVVKKIVVTADIILYEP
ncbi:hypothetical protein PUN28_016483 [Cardiocondyla obscurior]|uniref:Uncharacterized protein n=1 Tax=Cardiocondyla obscurior TaxID=286306 RepID=A0AAW2ENZ2_9HYME